MIACLDADGRFIRVNRAYADACGHPPEFFPGKDHFDLYPHPENEAIFRRVVETGEPFHVHAKPFEHPDRPERGVTYWDWSFAPVKEPDGRVGTVVFSLLDVTERRRAEEELTRYRRRLEVMVAERTARNRELSEEIRHREEVERALQESETLFRTMFRDAPVGILLADTDGRVIRSNATLEELLDYDEEELRGKAIAGFLHPEDVGPLSADLDSLRSGRIDSYTAVRRYRRKDGRFVWCRATASLIAAPGEGASYILGMMIDISAQLEAEQALQASEQRFRRIFEQNEEPVILFRPGSVEIMDANPAAERLYGFSREDLCAGGPVLFVGPENLKGFEEALAALPAGGSVNLGNMKHRRRDGGQIIVSGRANPISLREGHVSYCTFHDITARVRLEKAEKLQQAQLIHASRMVSLGSVVSGVAHEINNPNNLIMFNVPMIEAAWHDAAPVLAERLAQEGDFSLGGLPCSEMKDIVPRLLTGISEAAQRIKNIVANLKDFARQDKARTVRPLNVNEVVRLAVAILNHEIMKGTHDFRVDYGESLPPVEGSAQELEQVVVNLITNALQALPDTFRAVRVSTSADREQGRVLIVVEDEGTGMTKEALEHVAEPFFTTKHDRGGLGLGLSISRSIVEAHGGSISFESEIGKGTTVRVALPVQSSALEEEAAAKVML
jgi:PAS domain S-box-containing protein